jgi:hypothetical protein
MQARLQSVTEEAVEILRFVLMSSEAVTLPADFISKVLTKDYFAMVVWMDCQRAMRLFHAGLCQACSHTRVGSVGWYGGPDGWHVRAEQH